MKQKDYRDFFFDRAKKNYDGMYFLDTYGDIGNVNVPMLRKNLNKCGYKTRYKDGVLYAIEKEVSWGGM